MSYIVVIPARFKSGRLPGKPLIQLCGVPMIVRTYAQCIKVVPPELVYVATDDDNIKDECEKNNIQVLMTDSNCLTGTDRVAEVAKIIKVDTYINVQGDEPIFNPDDLRELIKKATENPLDIINGYCAIKDEEMYRSSSIPKVIMRPDGRLLYMSRAGVPTTKTHKFVKAWRQVCAYAFPRSALEMFTSTKDKTELELIEDIEILRFLELGCNVQMIPMSDISIAVDNPEDVVHVELAIKQLGLY